MRLASWFKIFFFFLPFFLFPHKTHAAFYDVSYDLTYRIQEDLSTIKAELGILITQARPDLYVSTFKLALPAHFDIEDIQADSRSGPVNFQKEKVGETYELSFFFTQPSVGTNSVNDLTIRYTQRNVIRKTGTIVEGLLPILYKEGEAPITFRLIRPASMKESLSVAKPRPSAIDLNTLTWNGLTSKTIYVAFGESQHYALDLKYRLKNPGITPVLMDIALPPDTLYQQSTFQSLEPKPKKMYLDEDGNYLAQYELGPLADTSIRYRGQVILFAKPRSEMLGYVRGAIEKQKSYLLSAKPAWQLGAYAGNSSISSLKTVKDIFDFTTNHLTYSLSRISEDGMNRLGAQKALSSPQEAVCTEYADVFVAIAREKGIYARELEGYAYAFDPQLQPLSLRTDVLHAWPEFYDTARQAWLPVDPTWQDTSGIDYFSAMDFSHIVFAIHGKDDTYPLPAGSYKYEDSIDVQVTPTTKVEGEKKAVEVASDLSTVLSQGKRKKAMITIKNTGNTFLHDLSLTAFSQGVSLQFADPVVPLLAPGQEVIIPMDISSTHIGKKDILVQVGGIYDKTFTVTFQQSWKALVVPGSIGILVLLLGFILIALRRHNRHNDHKRAHTRRTSQ